ncbi:serine/threonine-protein kinase [Paraburkholderia unamae]|uniref:protein kinase domain-containing protein n=1 Tax=Paraburkholderia unamae TaxID=219649 RepID=UPI000DC2C9C0|nr:protein kinase [Paraburkholderia unamae]RAR57128.1 serine/threonine-protein kinase [Paraburkholderia unamae]
MSKSKKKAPKTLHAGDVFEGWLLEAPLGAGGNGDVWKAARPGQASQAIKILRSVSAETYERFKIETSTLERLGHLPGVIPLLEKFVPDDKSGPTPWFTMPVAIPFEQYVQGRNTFDIVEDFIALAGTIQRLHDVGMSHRDIKPANFLFYEGQLCLSDFGLVKYPNRAAITPPRRDVGAKFTMAPEMRRMAHSANGLPADVYSFAKSLWIALTDQELGFDGQYNPLSSLSLSQYLANQYTTTLDRLLEECTDSEPDRRPAMSSVIVRLQEWLAICRDFHTRNLTEWTELTRKLFPLGAPNRSTWEDVDAICLVLAEIAKIPALNHMFYPTGGGNTITAVSTAAEDGMIALHIGEKMVEILRPAKLTFESFGNDMNWSYFRLEAAQVAPSGVKGAISRERTYEALTEISPGHYVPYECWDHNEYNGEPLPDSARPASRYLSGAFVFFSTRSTYNGDGRTYDARHNKMSEAEFRAYIARHAQRD